MKERGQMVKIYIETEFDKNNKKFKDLQLFVSPFEIEKIIDRSGMFAMLFMEKSSKPDCIGETPKHILLTTILNVLNQVNNSRWEPWARNWDKEKTYSLIKELTLIEDLKSNEITSETQELRKEVEKLKKQIEKLKTKDYKNRALKASLTRSNKIIKMLTD